MKMKEDGVRGRGGVRIRNCGGMLLLLEKEKKKWSRRATDAMGTVP